MRQTGQERLTLGQERLHDEKGETDGMTVTGMTNGTAVTDWTRN